jgi:hypothetical protein
MPICLLSAIADNPNALSVFIRVYACMFACPVKFTIVTSEADLTGVAKNPRSPRFERSLAVQDRQGGKKIVPVFNIFSILKN